MLKYLTMIIFSIQYGVARLRNYPVAMELIAMNPAICTCDQTNAKVGAQGKLSLPKYTLGSGFIKLLCRTAEVRLIQL